MRRDVHSDFLFGELTHSQCGALIHKMGSMLVRGNSPSAEVLDEFSDFPGPRTHSGHACDRSGQPGKHAGVMGNSPVRMWRRVFGPPGSQCTLMAASRGRIPDDGAIVELVGLALPAAHSWRQRSTERPVARALLAPAEHPEMVNCRHQAQHQEGGERCGQQEGATLTPAGWARCERCARGRRERHSYRAECALTGGQ